MSHLKQLDNASSYERLSTATSVKSFTSNVDKDLIQKFDDKRKAKYNVLKELQGLDQGKIAFISPIIDETGKYKTGKCSVELFLFTCQKHGIEVNDQIRDGVREKVLPGGQDCINYPQAIKELNLRIISDDATPKNGSRL
jgi:hypothetical protein